MHTSGSAGHNFFKTSSISVLVLADYKKTHLCCQGYSATSLLELAPLVLVSSPPLSQVPGSALREAETPCAKPQHASHVCKNMACVTLTAGTSSQVWPTSAFFA